MKNNGFTLVELLAVIVVLGVIMAIAGTAVLGQRRKTNIEEAKKIEQTIADLGPGIYSYESSVGSDDSDSFMQFFNEGQPFKISQDTLISPDITAAKIVYSSRTRSNCSPAFAVITRKIRLAAVE